MMVREASVVGATHLFKDKTQCQIIQIKIMAQKLWVFVFSMAVKNRSKILRINEKIVRIVVVNDNNVSY